MFFKCEQKRGVYLEIDDRSEGRVQILHQANHLAIGQVPQRDDALAAADQQSLLVAVYGQRRDGAKFELLLAEPL